MIPTILSIAQLGMHNEIHIGEKSQILFYLYDLLQNMNYINDLYLYLVQTVCISINTAYHSYVQSVNSYINFGFKIYCIAQAAG